MTVRSSGCTWMRSLAAAALAVLLLIAPAPAQVQPTLPPPDETPVETAPPPVEPPERVRQQDADVDVTEPTAPDQEPSRLAAEETRFPAADDEMTPARPVRFWPELDQATLTWFAIIVILALSLRLRPLLSERNLDALVLAATCLLLTLRFDRTEVSLPGALGERTGQWWAYLLLAIAVGYWFLRGLRCLFSTALVRHESNLLRSGLVVFVIAGLLIGFDFTRERPVSPAAEDAIEGGQYFAATGRLPYGEVPGHDDESPLVYLLTAGAVELLPGEPVAPIADEPSVTYTAAEPMEFDVEVTEDEVSLEFWSSPGGAAYLVNIALYVLMLVALFIIGRRLHSAAAGLTLVAIFSVFPGTLEALDDPTTMLPATLLAWSVAFCLLPGVGGLLGGLFIVLAGLAWPWAWLMVPVVLFYFFRHGFEALGAIAGVLGGIALILFGITVLTLPQPPQADRALTRAGKQPVYVIERGDDEVTLVIEERPPGEVPEKGWLGWLWGVMVNSESVTLDPAETGAELSTIEAYDIPRSKLTYQNLTATDEIVRAELNERYRRALRREPAITQMWASVRTVLEQTWLAEPEDLHAPAAWVLWSRGSANEARWALIRKGLMIVVGVGLVLVAVIAIARRRNPLPAHLIGGLLVVGSASLFASLGGAANHIVWLLPLVLSLWALHSVDDVVVTGRPANRAAYDAGAPPRITVER